MIQSRAWTLVLSCVTCLIACEADTRPPREAVAVDVYLMPTCPFAHEALGALLPALDRFGAGPSLRVHHIGGVLESGSLDSMYGAADLQAGRVQVCAQRIGGESALRSVLRCQLHESDAAVQRCLVGLSTAGAKLTSCVEGAEGTALLRASFERSRKVSIRESPTIVLDGVPYSGGHSETHFARALCRNKLLATQSACKALPQPVAVDITLVDAGECEGKTCLKETIQHFLKQKFEGVRIRVVSPHDEAVEGLRRAAGNPALPFAVVAPQAKQDAYGFSAIASRVLPIDGDPRLLLPLSGFAPGHSQGAQLN